MLTCEPQRLLDAIIIFAPEVMQSSDDFFCHSLQSTLAEHLPVHLLTMDGIPRRAERFASTIFPSCIVHSLPRKVGSIQAAALAEILRKEGILRPRFVILEPKFVSLAMRAYAPLKTFGLLGSLAQTISKWKDRRRQVDIQLLHCFLTRQVGFVFYAEDATMNFLRKDLGYYGSVLTPSTLPEHLWNTIVNTIKNQREHTPLYPHKLDILVIMEAKEISQSVWADFIITLQNFSRHRIRFVQQQIWQDELREKAMPTTCHGYDVVIIVIEDSQQNSFDTEITSFIGYKIILLGRSQPMSIAATKQAAAHRTHHIITAEPIPQTLADQYSSIEFTGNISSGDWQAFDELLTNRISGIPNRLLLGQNNILAYGLLSDSPLDPEKEWEDPLDEAYCIENYLQKLPLVESGLSERLKIQRDKIDQLDQQIAELTFKCDSDFSLVKRHRGWQGLIGRILNSLRKRYVR